MVSPPCHRCCRGLLFHSHASVLACLMKSDSFGGMLHMQSWRDLHGSVCVVKETKGNRLHTNCDYIEPALAILRWSYNRDTIIHQIKKTYNILLLIYNPYSKRRRGKLKCCRVPQISPQPIVQYGVPYTEDSVNGCWRNIHHELRYVSSTDIVPFCGFSHQHETISSSQEKALFVS